MDTNKMRDISREHFEAVFNEKYPLTFAAAKSGESEAHGAASIAWWGWQASREAVVVELPSEDTCRTSTSKEEAVQEAYNHALGECRSAIEAQGLKVAP